MKLSINKIKELDSDEIFELLLSNINKIYDTFSFIDISKEEYKKIVLEEIEMSKNEYNGNIEYIDYIKDRIVCSITDKISIELEDNSKALIILNNYINKNLYRTKDYNLAIKQFEKLSTLFERFNYTINLDIIVNLINNNIIFLDLIEVIFNKNRNDILFGKMEDIFNNNLLSSIIEAYCILNNIEIKEEINNEEDLSDYYTADGFKAYINDVIKYPLLTREEELLLTQRVQNGDEKAKEKLIKSNLKYVIYIAKKYKNYSNDFLDLIQEGNLGLIKATEKYDPSKGVKFTTYAKWWIRDAITKFIAEKGKNIRTPFHIYEKQLLLNKSIQRLKSELNREPTEEEIANDMQITVFQIQKLLELKNDTISYNSLIGEYEDEEYSKFIYDDGESVEELLFSGILKDDVNSLLEKCNLSKKELDIIKLRYGFDGFDPLTLEEIGKKYNITRERVRQLENRILKKIRNSKYIKEFADYMDLPNQAIENIDKFRKEYSKKIVYNSIKNGKENNIKRNIKDNNRKRNRSIYELFNNYKKEEIDGMILRLSNEDRMLINLRYGSDLESPVFNKLTEDQKHRFYASLVPKMRRLLENPNTKLRNRRKGKKSIIDYNGNIKSKEINEEKLKAVTDNIEMKEEDINKVQKEVKTNDISKEIISEVKENNCITKTELLNILDIIKTPLFKQIISTLPVKDAIIVSLSFSYSDEKFYSTKSIANFLQIKESDVLESIKKALLLYKKNISEYVDNIINNLSNGNNDFTLILK